MPLSKDDKANIDLIDAKINKLQEQINNLANSKLYTKVLPDPPSLAVILLELLAFLKKYNFSTAGNCTIKSDA